MVINSLLAILIVWFVIVCITLAYKALQSEKLSELEAAVISFTFIAIMVVISYQGLVIINT